MVVRDTVHTVPAEKEMEHITDSLDCWCSPSYLQPCDDCEDGCWKCIDGCVPLTRTEAGALGVKAGLIVVHNR